MTKKVFFILLTATISGVAAAQQDTMSEKTLSEVVVSANKFLEKKKNIAQKIDVITSRQVAVANAQNTGDLLINTGNVFVQKSQQGGSSPTLRGFEASRVLLVIDGIRMNNAIYRAGHLQNVITVDQNMLERVEILYGPASTLYGGDALGGVVYLRTKSPKLSLDNRLFTTGSAFTRYSSANDEKTMHGDISIGSKRVAWLQSFTYSYFGDMKMGDNYPEKYPAFGRRDSLIAAFGFKDSVIANNDSRVQKFSGYKQWDVVEKILFRQNEKTSHSLNFQYSTTTDVPRYDRLQDKRNFGGSIGSTLRYAQWFYGPQERILGAYELNVNNCGFFNELKANINFQNIEESRQQREYRRYDRFDSRIEKVKVWGFVIDGRKLFGNNELSIGTDGQLNDVKSTATRTNLTTGAISKLDTRYPDGKNKVNYFGLYAQHLLKISDGEWILNDGLRLQTISLRSNVIDNSFFSLPVTHFEQNNFAVTGNIGLVFLPSERCRIALGLSSGFRSPNLDDLVKIFDFSVAKRVYVPNADINPEYTYNVDLSISHIIAQRVRFEVTGFYTLFRNAIVSAPFQLNGQDSIVYNGVNSAVYANQNLNKAFLYGFSSNINIDLADELSVFSTISYTYGRIKKLKDVEVPLDHIPPVFGKTSLNYRHSVFGLELYAMYNGWKKIENYNPDGEDNQQYATPDGIPGWFTLNWRGNCTIHKNLKLQLAVENIFDRNYRYFASGFSAPGRNLIVALRLGF
jgi:hemoglobin/transferrin/lactoferrin receptor protein